MKFRLPNPNVRPLIAIAAVFCVAWLASTTIRDPHEAYRDRMPRQYAKTATGANSEADYRVLETDTETATFLSGARAQIGVTVGYDPSYQKLDFPMGDVPISVGVCSDVVVRAYRGVGIDLQAEVNADMKADFSKYPTKYGLSAPDANIDHRRVPNLMTFFDRK